AKVDAKSDLAKATTSMSLSLPKRKISLKATTLNNDRQKVNDALGNPIIIGVVVIWQVVDTAKAVFNVENYIEYLSIQCDAALRNVVRNYPYDSDEDEQSLRGSAITIAQEITDELQDKVQAAGLNILECRITHLSYAPEIAAAMLQRQQATAIIAARQKIVEGAVGMVEMALTQLNEGGLVELDEERKAHMVSNLLTVLTGNRDVQPIVNTGSIY
ncbi:MAG: SPFH domain-containing protein, partial [Spirochaetales bacterium]|nr:SPFH domain-containing protein [Spirochaetales bacterium]